MEAIRSQIRKKGCWKFECKENCNR